MSRLDMIRSVMEKSPNDPFPRYGFAMELRSLGRLDEAVAAFAELQTRFPDYVPQYLMAAQILVEKNDRAGAKSVVTAGVAAAKRKGDSHALGELSALASDLENDD